jgi:hypothetical protein
VIEDDESVSFLLRMILEGDGHSSHPWTSSARLESRVTGQVLNTIQAAPFPWCDDKDST